MPLEIHALSPEAVEDPHAIWAQLRDEAPVYWDPSLEVFLVSRYEDVQRVVLDAKLFSSAVGAMSAPPPLEAIRIIGESVPPANTLITADPPEHLGYRKIVAKVFAPRRVAKLRDQIESVAVDLADAFMGRGFVELVSEYAAPFPLAVIADQLGVPRSRVGDFKRWSDAFMDFIGGLASEERSVECAKEIVECHQYFTQRRKEYEEGAIADEGRDDMLSVLIRARLDDGRPLNEGELGSILSQFMLAGNETSTAAITATWKYLIEQPDVLESVRADRSLVPNVMEEVFRLESPVQNIFRMATEDTKIQGVEIPAGSKVGVMYGSANYDPRVFPSPEKLDPHRPNVREHLAFGQGNHYCVGAGLARLEGAIALETLLDRFDDVRFAPGKNDFRHNPIYIARSLKALHLEFDQRTA